jgi:hypothetical protein
MKSQLSNLAHHAFLVQNEGLATPSTLRSLLQNLGI